MCQRQNRSTEGCSKLKRSVDMTSSGKNGLNIRTNASPKWDRTSCPESCFLNRIEMTHETHEISCKMLMINEGIENAVYLKFYVNPLYIF